MFTSVDALSALLQSFVGLLGMGCGAGARQAGPAGDAAQTSTPVVADQVALAIFAVVTEGEQPKQGVKLDSSSEDAPEIAWQSGSMSCDKWTDLSATAMKAIENCFSAFDASFGEKEVSLDDDDGQILVNFEDMSLHKVGDQGFVNTVDPSSEGEVDPETVFPIRRLVAPKWEVSHPDPGEIHPLRSDRIAKRAGDDWLNNDFFWRAFQEVMKQNGYTEEVSSADLMFDFAYNQDFRSYKGRVQFQQRGGVEYRLPVGWKRFAVRVSSKFDDGDNTWMCLDGRQGEWAVAYHGTNQGALLPIMQSGLKAGSGQVYASEVGKGIYCSPDLGGVARSYANDHHLDGHKVRFVIQCRVRPDAIKKCSRTDYWVINNSQDIRPYGILVREE